jgi:oligopeptide transport system substrate-binding protein
MTSNPASSAATVAVAPPARSRRRSTFPRLAACAFASVFFFAPGCGKRSTSVETATRTGTLHVGIGGEPSELDPHVINAPPDYRLIFAFFEGLTMNDPVTSEPRPAVAERWTSSPDGLTWTFHLRRDARWSNGDALTAADFLASFRRALSPTLGSQYTLLFNPVRGAEAFAAGKLKDFAQVGFAAPDPHTLVITLAQPTPYFLTLVTGNPIWFPIHPATVAKHGALDRRGTGWTRPGRFVGNGPFTLKEWRPNQVIVAEKSATYWDAARVPLRAVHFHPIDNVDAEERAFRAGQLHLTNSVPVARLANYRAEQPSPLRTTPILTVRFITVNTARPALSDARVRRALSLALDRTVFSERVLQAAEGPAYALIPPGMPGYTSTAQLEEDVAAARALLAAAGFPEGRGFPALTLARESGGARDLAEAIQQAWRSKLGLDIRILESESRTHWSTLQLKNYDLAIAGWNADYADPSTFLDLFLTGGGWNFTHWGDPAFDSLMRSSSGELDPAKRLDLLQRAEAHLLAALPIIPLTVPRARILVAPSVRDWHLNPLDRPTFTRTSVQ